MSSAYLEPTGKRQRWMERTREELINECVCRRILDPGVKAPMKKTLATMITFFEMGLYQDVGRTTLHIDDVLIKEIEGLWERKLSDVEMLTPECKWSGNKPMLVDCIIYLAQKAYDEHTNLDDATMSTFQREINRRGSGASRLSDASFAAASDQMSCSSRHAPSLAGSYRSLMVVSPSPHTTSQTGRIAANPDRRSNVNIPFQVSRRRDSRYKDPHPGLPKVQSEPYQEPRPARPSLADLHSDSGRASPSTNLQPPKDTNLQGQVQTGLDIFTLPKTRGQNLPTGRPFQETPPAIGSKTPATSIPSSDDLTKELEGLIEALANQMRGESVVTAARFDTMESIQTQLRKLHTNINGFQTASRSQISEHSMLCHDIDTNSQEIELTHNAKEKSMIALKECQARRERLLMEMKDIENTIYSLEEHVVSMNIKEHELINKSKAIFDRMFQNSHRSRD